MEKFDDVRSKERSRLEVFAKHDQYADQKDQRVKGRMVDWASHLCSQLVVERCDLSRAVEPKLGFCCCREWEERQEEMKQEAKAMMVVEVESAQPPPIEAELRVREKKSLRWLSSAKNVAL